MILRRPEKIKPTLKRLLVLKKKTANRTLSTVKKIVACVCSPRQQPRDLSSGSKQPEDMNTKSSRFCSGQESITAATSSSGTHT